MSLTFSLGGKKDKSRISIAFTTNILGSERLQPLIIGHYNQPRCFGRRTSQALGTEFHFEYHYNANSWMTGNVFQTWLSNFDRQMQGRRVLLLVDNARCHVARDVLLHNITVHFLPPNTTSKLQPLDSGTIAAFKRRYRNLHMEAALDNDENGEEDIYSVLL